MNFGWQEEEEDEVKGRRKMRRYVNGALVFDLPRVENIARDLVALLTTHRFHRELQRPISIRVIEEAEGREQRRNTCFV